MKGLVTNPHAAIPSSGDLEWRMAIQERTVLGEFNLSTNSFAANSLDHLDQVHPEGSVERAVDDHVGRRVDDEQDVAEEEHDMREK